MNKILISFKESKFLNFIFFRKSINKLKHEGLKKYLSSIFLLKNILLKIVLLILLGLLIFGLGFGLRHHYLYKEPNDVLLNPGIAFSHLANQNSSVVYFVQSIPCIISFLVFLFVPQWWISFGFIMMFCGGLMNIIDRSMSGQWFYPSENREVNLEGKVVDYFNGGSSVFNIADVFIIMGVCFAVLSIIIYVVILYKKEKAMEQERQAKGEFDPLDSCFDEDIKLEEIHRIKSEILTLENKLNSLDSSNSEELKLRITLLKEKINQIEKEHEKWD